MESTELVTEIVESTEVITEYITEVVVSCEHCETFIEYLSSIDILLFRGLQIVELFLAITFAVLFVSVCYNILKSFTRF